jgi:hypothetical protein
MARGDSGSLGGMSGVNVGARVFSNGDHGVNRKKFLAREFFSRFQVREKRQPFDGLDTDEQIYGVGLEPTVVVGEGDAVAGCSSGNFKLLKSALLITNVPSRPSTRAHNVPSLF